MEETDRYPLEILPKEMWEKIILELDDWEDARSLMESSKQLNNIFSRLRHFWLLDKVLPFLMPTTKLRRYWYLEPEDVAKLRLVDKRWNRAVNSFLENQPELRPYNKEDDKVNSEAHIWSDCQLNTYRSWGSGPVGRVAFRDYDQIDSFGENFKNPEKNPFPSRSVFGYTTSYISWWKWENNCRPPFNLLLSIDPAVESSSRTFWEDMIENVFKKFGKHVWFLTMFWNKDENDDQRWEPELMWKSIVNSLSSLTNLKRLDLHINNCVSWLHSDAEEELLKLDENQLPHLPFLESLRIHDFHFVSFPHLFYKQLMSKYSLQLRKLQMNLSRWDTRQKWMFPNLVELCLEEISKSKYVTEVLESLEAPQLAKLELTQNDSSGYCSRLNVKLDVENDIFPWITLFPSLVYLDISDPLFRISERGTLEPGNDSKLSLKYLKIHNWPEVNFNFLRCLPNIERLRLTLINRATSTCPILRDCSAYPEVRIKLELETCSIYQSNVWELCPKLKTLSLYYQLLEFDRVTYEKLKNSAEPRNLTTRILEFLDRKKCSETEENEATGYGSD